MAIIKTAILQTHVYMEKSRNINRAVELLASPELKDIDLAVLPEMFCCPYENKYFPEYAEPEGGDTWEKCSNKQNGLPFTNNGEAAVTSPLDQTFSVIYSADTAR